jgi:hypothetical protein
MNRNLITILVFVFALSLGILSCGSSNEEKNLETAPPTTVDVKQFIKEKCNMCHFTDRVYDKKRAPLEWLNLVKRMRLKNTSWISEQEADMILNYLVKNWSVEG